MRITFQPSSGRGEYEVCDYAPNGLMPIHLLGLSVHLQMGTIVFQTGVILTKDQGKYRLRVVPKGMYPQIPLQIAALLLLPHPVREEPLMGVGELVLQNKSYILKNIHFGDVMYHSGDSFFTAEILTLDCANRTIEAEQVAVVKRVADIEKIWQQRDRFPPDIRRLLEQHEEWVRAGTPLPRAADGLVQRLQKQVEAYSSEVAIPYSAALDVVPALLSVLSDIVEETPLSLDQIEPEQVELRRRLRTKWQVWARRRGAASVRFSKDVRSAYHQCCVMCGGRFPATAWNENPGVDAAHILPWADYDLDRVSNGVTLCKLHHWAFDEGILLIVFRNGVYFIELSEKATDQLAEPAFSLNILRQVVGEIPQSRLPTHTNDWPMPQFLALRNEEFAS